MIHAIFVSCSLNLLICKDLYMLPERKFEDTDACRAYVKEMTTMWADRIPSRPVVMGKCVWHFGR